MRCPQAKKLLQPFIDGELSANERSDLENHLADCAPCSEAFEGLQAVDEWACSILHEEPTDAYLEHFQVQVLEEIERPDPRRVASSAAVTMATPTGQTLPYAWGIPLALSLGLVLLAVAVNPLADQEGSSGWFSRTDKPGVTDTVKPTPKPTATTEVDVGPLQPPTQRFQTGRPDPAHVPASQAISSLDVDLALIESELNDALSNLADLKAQIDRETEQEKRFLAEGER